MEEETGESRNGETGAGEGGRRKEKAQRSGETTKNLDNNVGTDC